MPRSRFYIPLCIFVLAVLFVPLSAFTCRRVSKELSKIFAGYLSKETMKHNCHHVQTAVDLAKLKPVDPSGCFLYFHLKQALLTITIRSKPLGSKMEETEAELRQISDKAHSSHSEEPNKVPSHSKSEEEKESHLLKAEVKGESDELSSAKASTTSNEEGTSALVDSSVKVVKRSAISSDGERKSGPAKPRAFEEIPQLVNATLWNHPQQGRELKRCASTTKPFCCGYIDGLDAVICHFPSGEAIVRNLNGPDFPLKEAGKDQQ